MYSWQGTASCHKPCKMRLVLHSRAIDLAALPPFVAQVRRPRISSRQARMWERCLARWVGVPAAWLRWGWWFCNEVCDLSRGMAKKCFQAVDSLTMYGRKPRLPLLRRLRVVRLRSTTAPAGSSPAPQVGRTAGAVQAPEPFACACQRCRLKVLGSTGFFCCGLLPC